jgi:hypothetical protein
MKWEKIDDYSYRAKAYKGWLVKCYEHGSDVVTLAFVPDAMHAWAL